MAYGTGGGQQYKVTDDEANTCSGGTYQTTYTTLPDYNDAMSVACSTMEFDDTKDTLYVDFHATIGQDLTPGNYSENVTFWAATDVS